MNTTAAACSALLLATTSATAQDRPNIVVLMADDLGWADVSFNGGEIATPNIDALAAEGRTLDRFYVQPQCTPTRASFMTGRYPLRDAMHYGVVLPFSEWGLPLDTSTLAELLQDEGYTTAAIGKWHLGHHAPQYLPLERGFDHFFGHYLGSHNYFEHGHAGGYDQHRNGEVTYEPGYATDLFGLEAVRLIDAHDQSDPLFLYVAFNAPHDPWQSKDSDLRSYQHMDGVRQKYAGMTTAMDRAIGRITRSLEDAGMMDNTLTVFFSDNGGPWPGDVTDNGPLRGGKGNTFEGGIRVPAFAVWPAEIPAGTQEESLLYVGDLFTTFLSLAGTDDLPTDVDGIDVTDALTGEGPSGRSTLPIISGPDWFWNAVIDWPWKIVTEINDGDRSNPHRYLFNLEHDPSETTNLADEHPEILERLSRELEYWVELAAPSSFTYGDARGTPPEIWGVFENRDSRPNNQ
ncbi:MAG: sulfatase-like hydrolase/transferase [Planctomycetota bacterium]